MTDTREAGVVAPSRKWIIGRYQDLGLFIATPLMILPGFLLLKTQMGVQDIALYILAFGALGHHLPGMMRAYGDRGLFTQYRARFIVAPLVLAGTCIAATLLEIRALLLIVYLWGMWHGLMQTYGFMRIYDSKQGSLERLTKRLDLAVCVSWFLSGMLMSEARLYQLLDFYYIRVGGPVPGPIVLEFIRYGSLGVTIVLTILFLLHHLRLRSQGNAPSGLKVLLLATTVGFWWFSNMYFSSMIVGVVLFEVFHDVQYLSIVWVFNRGRADKDPQAGMFTRFLFQRSAILLGVYLGMVCAYGSLRMFERGINEATVRAVVTGLLAASTLLHFYYDGFIWKFRKKENRDALAITQQESRRGKEPTSGGYAHASKWALYLVPLVLLGARETSGREGTFDRLMTLSTMIPHNPYVHDELADVYKRSGEHVLAIASYERALEEGITSPATRYHLGALLVMNDGNGRLQEGIDHLRKSIEIDPFQSTAYARLGDVLRDRAAGNDVLEADMLYRDAIAREPGQWRAWCGLASLALAGGNAPEAPGLWQLAMEAHGKRAFNEGGKVGAVQYDGGGGLHYDRIRKMKDSVAAGQVADRIYSLAGEAGVHGHTGIAIAACMDAISLAPRQARYHFALGHLWYTQGNAGASLSAYDQAWKLDPIPELHYYIGQAREMAGEYAGAAEAYEASIDAGLDVQRAGEGLERVHEEAGRIP